MTREVSSTTDTAALDGGPLAALTHGDPTRVADRYQVERLLGRGGMGSAYRARDTVTGNTVALKLLFVGDDAAKVARSIELFEREFHTLMQLAHPRVVRALDYGVDGDNPYYTMEVLDGGDLRERSPMPWRRVCTLAYEICSVLSLLHSRRLVHRDLTPRNIRLTTDGKAKLIDFGLLSRMGPAALLAGTPPFVAPEVVNSMSLDGRSDLFSLGVTLYYALTGRLAFSARGFETLRDAWRTSPVAPSKIVPGIPSALDDLVLGMLRIDAGSRPKSAAEVMDRLLPLLEAPPDEDLRVASAYLASPQLVGRDDLVVAFRKQVVAASRRRGGGFVISGDAGMGRSRMLDAFVLEAKLVGATTIRAGSTQGHTPFGVAAALVAQLHEASPADALDLTRPDLDRTALLVALRAWLLEFASQRALAIAIDDIDQVDEPSAALLASLTWEAPKHRLAYAATLETGASATAPTAVSVVRKHAVNIELRALSAENVAALLGSVFGDVPNLQLLSNRLHALSTGRPRECMVLAQFLVDEGAITYEGGTWTLPAEIGAGLLPASIEESLERQMAALGSLAKRVIALVALSLVERLSRAQLMRLPGAVPAALDRALDELLAARMLTGDTSGYALRHGSLGSMATSKLSPRERAELHEQLSVIYERSEVHSLLVAYHKLGGHRPEEGLDYLVARIGDSQARTEISTSAATLLGADRAARAFELALHEAERLQRPRRHLQAFWVILAGLSAQGEDAHYYYLIPAAWLDQLKADSGFSDWHKLSPDLDPGTRAMMAVGAAAQRYGETPEAERVLAPPDAIKQLVSYVVFSVAVSARVIDLPLMASLPALLTPFAPLNPMAAAMLGNARGTLLNGEGKREQAREAFLDVLKRLDDITGAELAYVDKVRASLLQTIAEIDASLGVSSAYVDRLEHEQQDPNQLVGARYVRKVAALHRGDWEAAERHRQKAELLTLQIKARPMFSTLGQELEAHAKARDLTGLKQVRAGIGAMALRHPGWVPVMHVADAHYLRLCGDLEGALLAARSARVVGIVGSLRSPWAVEATTIEVEVLCALGRASEGLALGQNALAECERDTMPHLARGLAAAVAQAEAKLGQLDAAMSRAEAVIAEQVRLGVSGLSLGHSYELCARIALGAGDAAAFEKYLMLTAAHYRPGESSVLGALYERLMEDAREVGMIGGATHSAATSIEATQLSSSRSRVTSAMVGCQDREERAARALGLLCDTEPPSRGHLFLIAENGLVLAASNTPSPASPLLLAFAQSYLDLELEGGDGTMSAGQESGSLATEPATAEWNDVDGTRYRPLLLGTTLNESFVVGGIAVLIDGQEERRHTQVQLAAALAQMLIESGDARGVVAA